MMKFADHRRVWRLRAAGWLTVALVLLAALPAQAALGGDLSSVVADRQKTNAAKLEVRTSAPYSVQQFETDSGTVIREYVGADGKVFAVAWEGPFMPDLRQLLGTYFEQFAQAGTSHRGRRGPLLIDQPGFVMHSGGHMRAFFGQAYVPQMLPQGVRPEDLR